MMRPRYRLFIVAVFFAFMLLHQSDKLLIGPLTTPIMEEFGLDEAQMGAVFTGALIVGAIFLPLWGYFYDRYARAKLLALASFIWGATTWLSAIAPTYPSFLATRASTGVDDSSYPGIFSLVSDYFGPEMRGRVFGILNLTSPLGYMIGLALALALVRQKQFDPHTICTLKAQMVEKSAALQFSQFTETFATLGGLENLKDWTLNRFKNRKPGLPFRGILLLGVPGTGKSHFAKALGNEVGWPVLSLDMGRVFGSLVGESEAKMREALKVVDAMAPCVLFIDEIEKGLAGVGGSSTDGGTTQRVGGTFLTWLNDHTSQVFVIATCNDYSKIPPEYTRMGRWDSIWFVDNPGPREQLDILDIYLKQFLGKTIGTLMADSDGRVKIPDLDGYSGAEIRQVAIEAAYNSGDLEAAARFVIPISKSQKQQMDALREWARTRTIPASKALAMEEVKAKRRVQL
jgi:hypothetical protein